MKTLWKFETWEPEPKPYTLSNEGGVVALGAGHWFLSEEDAWAWRSAGIRREIKEKEADIQWLKQKLELCEAKVIKAQGLPLVVDPEDREQ